MLIDLKKRWLIVCFACLSVPLQAHGGGPDVLTELLDERRCENYVPATFVRQQRAEDAFASLLQGRSGLQAGQDPGLTVPGFTLEPLEAGGVKWQVLREDRESCTGQGLYLFREGGSAGLVVQVPHGYHDLHTDDIALGLIDAPVRAIAFNTVPRTFRQRGVSVDADLAHRTDSLFMALTRAFARVYPEGRLVQLHGYSPKKRKSTAAAGAAAIVSAGKSRTTAHAEAVAECLRPLLGGPVLLYPHDVRELGGTRNAQGKTLRRQGHNGFVHVELNRVTRNRLRNQDKQRSAFAGCMSNRMVAQ